MTTGDALWAGAVMMLGGVAVGALVTLYGSMRAVWRFRRWRTLAADWLWFVVVAVVLAAALFVADWGALRAWTLVAAGLGVGLWLGLADPLVFPICRAVFRAIQAIFRFLAWPWRTAVAGTFRVFSRLADAVHHRRPSRKPPAQD